MGRLRLARQRGRFGGIWPAMLAVARFALIVLGIELAHGAVSKEYGKEVEKEVSQQYVEFPYPPRRSNTTLIGKTRSSDWLVLNERLFGGKRSLASPLRILVAGCGTGDDLNYLSVQLSSWTSNVEIVGLELSASSVAIARQRLERWKKHISLKVSVVHGSILDLQSLNLGTFDLINCIGVLHHIADADLALQLLADALKPDGGMVLMVYAPYGRIGVYQMQTMARMLSKSSGLRPMDRTVVNMVRGLESELPKSHHLKLTAPVNGDAFRVRDGFEGDATITNAFMHMRALALKEDLSYTVEELVQFLKRAGLTLSSFINQLQYDPGRVGISSPDTLKAFENMDWLERAAFAELFTCHLFKHSFYALKAGNSLSPWSINYNDTSLVPTLRASCHPETAAREYIEDMGKPARVSISMTHGVQFTFPLSQMAGEIFPLLNGLHTTGEIINVLLSKKCSQGTTCARGLKEEIASEVTMTLKSLSEMSKLTLTHEKLDATLIPVGENNRKCDWSRDFG